MLTVVLVEIINGLSDSAISIAMPSTIEEYRRSQPHTLRVTGGRKRAGRDAVYSPGLVSVITACFNSARTIDRTIDSIVAQTYPLIEYIVIDGGSRDGTLERLRKREDVIDLWISEQDRGISDAFNKGVSLASGEFVAILNSDDWLDPHHLDVAIAELQTSGADFVFGDMVLHEPDGRGSHMVVGDPNYARKLPRAMPYINHPTLVCRRKLYEDFGLFDVSLSISMDYEWLVRMHRAGARGLHTSRLLGHMSLEGASDRRFLKGLAELRDTSIRYGYPAVWAWALFGLRFTRTRVRRFLVNWLPNGAYEWLRSRSNLNYRSIEGRTGLKAVNPQRKADG